MLRKANAALQFPLSDGTSAITILPTIGQRSGKFLAFDGSGNPIAASGVSSTVVSAAMTPVVQASTLANGRTALGLGSAATQNTGTSGATIPLNNGNNTVSGNNTFSGTNTHSGTNAFTGDVSIAPASGNPVQLKNTSTKSPDIINR